MRHYLSLIIIDIIFMLWHRFFNVVKLCKYFFQYKPVEIYCSYKTNMFCSFWRERTQRRSSSCECFGNQPLDFDEVTKCDEKQLNTLVNPETFVHEMYHIHQLSLFFFNMAAASQESTVKMKRGFLVDMKLAVDSVSLSRVLGLVLTVSHTTE